MKPGANNRDAYSMKGLDLLFGSGSNTARTEESLPLTAIVRRQKQPRRFFDEEELKKLADSIRKHGILEPLLVRSIDNGKYEIVAGERRYRGAKLAGLSEVPVIVKELSDEAAWEVAIVENVQREDLNPIDRVDAILQLLAFDFECAVAEVPAALYRLENENKGKVTRTDAGNARQEKIKRRFDTLGIRFSSFMRHELPLLNAPEEILSSVRIGKLDPTNALEIKKVKDVEQRQALLAEAIEQKLSVGEIRNRVKQLRANTQEQDRGEELTLQGRIDKTCKLLKSSKRSHLLDDSRKKKRLEKLLSELESLLGGG